MKSGSSTESLAYSLYLASMSSDTRDALRKRVDKAASAYRTASTSYRRTGRAAEAFRCDAMIVYLRHWCSDELSERKRLLARAWRLTVSGLERFERNKDENGFVSTYTQLALTAGLSFLLASTVKERLTLATQAARSGEEAIRYALSGEDTDLVARACTIASGFAGFLSYYSEPDERSRLLSKSDDLWHQAVSTSERAALLERAVQSRYSMAQSEAEVPGSNEAIGTWEKTLGYSRERGNIVVTCSVLDMIAYNLFYKLTSIEDPVESDRLADQMFNIIDESSKLYSPFSGGLPPQSQAALVPLRAEYHLHEARFEKNDVARRKKLEEARRESTIWLDFSKRSGVPEAEASATHIASKILAFIGSHETDGRAKGLLLRKALALRNRSAAFEKTIRGPSDLWNTGLHDNYLADITAETARLAKNPHYRARTLAKAIRLKERSLTLCGADKYVLEWGSSRPSAYYGALGRFQVECGEMYRELYDISHKVADLELASEKLAAAASSFKKLNQNIRVADAYWKRALIFESMNEHLEASESYNLASTNYSLASQKLLALKKFYDDLSLHMKARSEASKAQDFHRRGNYTAAEESYRNAAALEQSSGKWRYFSEGLVAFAELECSEGKSTRQLGEEAASGFRSSARMFQECQILIKTHSFDLDTAQEKDEAEALASFSHARQLYCLARADFEEARILQMKGVLDGAGNKYEQAIDTLQEVRHLSKQIFDQNEAKFIINLSRAWEAMARAEAGTSFHLFARAAGQFEEAVDACQSAEMKTLLLGHSRFCFSLQATSQFLDKGRLSDYQAAQQRLQSAANLYTKSGFHSASEHAKATKRLLEAHLYLNNANKQEDQGKKTQLYAMVEKLLAAAAESFSEAGYSGKKDHIKTLMDQVREEKDLAISLAQDIITPLAMPSSILPSNISSREHAVGVGQLQRACVVANLSSSPSVLRLGEPMSLKIELANAGMNTAQLLRVERVVPEGFDLLEKPGGFLMEERHLILEGKRLEPSKTEDLSFVLKPRIEGSLELSPRIFYLDETGQGRVHSPEPLEVIVRNGTDRSSSIVSSEPFQASPIMKFLTEAFIEDYMRRKLSIEHAGWRGLPHIAKSLRIPRSQVYGDPRYGHAFGQPLEKLVKRGIVDFRIFPGSRGRGGNAVKVRVAYEKEPVKRFVDSLAFTLPP